MRAWISTGSFHDNPKRPGKCRVGPVDDVRYFFALMLVLFMPPAVGLWYVIETTGSYGRIRHPRYLEILFFVFGYALFSNSVGACVVALLSVPALLLVVVLEEREPGERFGEAYHEYCRRVPRFVPRRGGK